MGLVQITSPTIEPIPREDAKIYLRQSGSDDDINIDQCLVAARVIVERETNRQLVTATWELTIAKWPSDHIELPVAPVSAITHIKYYDSDGVLQTWDAANYTLDSGVTPSRVHLAYNCSWPAIRANLPAQIQVRFVAGYGTPAAVPAPLKSAILLKTALLYLHRDEIDISIGGKLNPIPGAYEILRNSYRVILTRELD